MIKKAELIQLQKQTDLLLSTIELASTFVYKHNIKCKMRQRC